MLHTSESYGYNSFTKITIKSMWQVVKSNTIITNYFITFLQIIDMTNFLLVFTSPPLGKCHQSPSSDVPSITGKCQTRWKKLSGPNILCGSGSAINHHPVKCHQSQWSVKHGGKNYLVQTSYVEVEVPSITVQASKLEREITDIIN